MTPQQWQTFRSAAKGESYSQPAVAAIVDSPWIPGYTGTSYLDYFTLPGNERYYHFQWGLLEVFCLDSEIWEPDGIDVDSAQAAWLRGALAASTATWKLVALHTPPYSSGGHGSKV